VLAGLITTGALVASLLAPYGEPQVVLRLPAGIEESSGVASSSLSDDWLFTHQDSGDEAQFYAVSTTGELLATYRLGVQARDWEDMARGPDEQGRSSLWLGDIGDNSGTRDRGLLVHRVPEPQVDPARRGRTVDLQPVSFRLVYEDGPRDAEALLVHPRTGRLHVVSKEVGRPAGVYVAPEVLDPRGPNTLRRVGDVRPPGRGTSFVVTAGDIASDGSRVALRGYGRLLEWTLPDDDVAAAVRGRPTVSRLPATQGEGLAYTRDGAAVVTTSEGAGAPVHRLARTVAPARPSEPAPPGRSGSPAASAPAAADDPPYVVIGLAGVVLGAALVWLATRRRSRASPGR
jgi:hypothetical protein